MQDTYKPILDACCGGRMMWFDKHNPAVLYVDNRTVEEMRCCDGRRFEVKPDMVADFTSLPFQDNTFNHVLFDPPHLVRAGDDSYMAVKYGKLPKDWEHMIRDGFAECMRVLSVHGTLIFKWSEHDIPVKKVLDVIGHKPLYGHRSGKASKTHWIAFMKLPEEESEVEHGKTI